MLRFSPPVLALAAASLVGCSTPTRMFYDDSEGGLSAGGRSTTDGGVGGSGNGGGTSSSGGSAGQGGNPGTGGAAGGGGSGTGGAPGTEDCFDGVDNDQNAKVDCEDPACTAAAQCVTEPDNFQLGVVVDKTQACPAGTTETKIFKGLSGGTTCTGCTCTPNPVKCEADLFYYPSIADCNADTTNTAGALAKHLAEPCEPNVTILNSNIYTNGGFRAGAIQVIQSCDQAGTATVAPAQWTTSQKFCAYQRTGAGCAVGKKCVPAHAANAQCALASGSAICDGFASSDKDWFSGYTDTRTCEACSCTAFGGACQYPEVTVGSDYGCTAGFTLNGSDKNCQGEYVPAVGITAGAVASSCTASSKLTGTLTASGQQTLCCSPN